LFLLLLPNLPLKIKNLPNGIREGLETRRYSGYAFDDHIVTGLPKMRAYSLSQPSMDASGVLR